MYDDKPTVFGGNYQPNDWTTKYQGVMNIRQCIKVSQNIPMVKIMMELTPKKSIEYLKKMGITTLNDKEDQTGSLAIGGLSKGITPLEMAGAYAMIANDGVYTTPTFYTKVVDSNGNTVLTPNQQKTRVISEQNAYITRSIVQEPVTSGGTASFCKISGMDTCAKTGSTDKYKDRWLCGMTPYYTAACWWGFDTPETLTYANGSVYSVDGRNPAGQIWSQVMKDIHKDLPNKTFNTPSTGLTQAQVCRSTGCLATNTCTDTYTETFTTDNLPQKCEGHGTQRICQVSGKLANEYCPAESVKSVSYGGTLPKEQLGLWKTLSPSKTGNDQVTETCDVHKKTEEKPKNNTVENNPTVDNSKNNTTNTSNNTTGGNNTTTNNTTENTTTENKAHDDKKQD